MVGKKVRKLSVPRPYVSLPFISPGDASEANVIGNRAFDPNNRKSLVYADRYHSQISQIQGF